MLMNSDHTTVEGDRVRAVACDGGALPEGLNVGGDLDLGGTQVAVLPEGLTVDGHVYPADDQNVRPHGAVDIL